MAEDAKVGIATALLDSLKFKPFCDHKSTSELTPEQQAALHAFLHEVLAAYYRMSILVPEEARTRVLNKRFAEAIAKS
jgi:hypothetical protein